ncbi:hypothetical protein F4818DRAFT_431855 [Hypoxylon cercidicola]|nr:hypothetical protein F4818DRAFT_431855 [Hypoxylon cercidicola]
MCPPQLQSGVPLQVGLLLLRFGILCQLHVDVLLCVGAEPLSSGGALVAARRSIGDVPKRHLNVNIPHIIDVFLALLEFFSSRFDVPLQNHATSHQPEGVEDRRLLVYR